MRAAPATKQPVQLINAHAGALWAAKRGLRVLRVAPGGKIPYRNGVNEATTDAATIERWFAEEPRLNYGIAMGGPDRLVALDCDTKHACFHVEYLGLGYPTTLEFESCSGGAHIVFSVDFDAGQKDLAGAASINVRAEGGYIVGPGSIVDGKRYRIVVDAPIANAPDDLAGRISRRGEKAADNSTAIGDLDTLSAMARAIRIVAEHPGVDEGGRDNECFRVACRVKDEGISEPECLEIMLQFNAEKCNPPQPGGDIERVVSSAYRNGQRPPGAANPANEFDDVAAAVAEALGIKPVVSLLEHASDVRLDDIIARQSRALVKGILHPGDAAIMYGESTAGKSFIGLDLAWHVAMGKPWHGRKVTKAPVLYVALEGVDGFRKRMLAALQVHGDPGEWFARLNLHVSLVKAEAGAAGMNAIVEAARQLAEKAGQPVGAIVIDTFARATAGDDENATDAVMHFVDHRAGAIARKTGAAVMTVAHTNRAGDLRGSLHLRNPMDVVLKVMRDEDNRAVIGEKVKDGQEGTLFDFSLQQVHLGEDEDGDAVTSCVVAGRLPSAMTTAKDTGPQRRLRQAYNGARLKHQGDDPPLADVRDEFMSQYPTGERDPEKAGAMKRAAWSRALRELPNDIEVIDRSGAEILRARGRSDPRDEFEPVDASARTRAHHDERAPVHVPRP